MFFLNLAYYNIKCLNSGNIIYIITKIDFKICSLKNKNYKLSIASNISSTVALFDGAYSKHFLTASCKPVGTRL